MHSNPPTLPTLPVMPALLVRSDISKQPTPHTQPDIPAIKKGVTGPLYRLPQPDPTTPGDLSLRPIIATHATGSMNDVLRILDQQGLSRTHRRLFLLINGQRSIKDLAALIGRTLGETATMLADLERASLIQL
jgi:hypothetical protein